MIKAILFDVNGTLRNRIPDAVWQEKSVSHLLDMLGKPDAPASYLDELARRYKGYIQWADENHTSLSETEIWARWITPELPRELIEPQAAELMLAFRSRRGRHTLKPDATRMIATLHQRGYKLGVISNTTSTVDIPRFMEEQGLQKYFGTIILSSACGMRKPDARIFLEAAKRLQVEPGRCAYLGNKARYDIAGPRRAGYGLTMIMIPEGQSLESDGNLEHVPDRVIRGLIELLDIFPAPG